MVVVVDGVRSREKESGEEERKEEEMGVGVHSRDIGNRGNVFEIYRVIIVISHSKIRNIWVDGVIIWMHIAALLYITKDKIQGPFDWFDEPNIELKNTYFLK